MQSYAAGDPVGGRKAAGLLSIAAEQPFCSQEPEQGEHRDQEDQRYPGEEARELCGEFRGLEQSVDGQVGGRTVREYEITAQDAEIEVAPGIMYPAWTYNGQVPGPTLRATEGDRIRITFKNRASHPHTMHFHGIHPADMDGMFEIVGVGQEYVYEFDAEPFGSHIRPAHESMALSVSW